jgi:hypothetical protein
MAHRNSKRSFHKKVMKNRARVDTRRIEEEAAKSGITMFAVDVSDVPEGVSVLEYMREQCPHCQGGDASA